MKVAFILFAFAVIAQAHVVQKREASSDDGSLDLSNYDGMVIQVKQEVNGAGGCCYNGCNGGCNHECEAVPETTAPPPDTTTAVFVDTTT